MLKVGILLPTLAAAVVISSVYPGRGTLLSMQSGSTVGQQSRELSDQELKGEGLFLQRCSLCHLSKRNKFCCREPLGPTLSGKLKGSDPETERFVREQILRGSANMPGFQYGLSPVQVDALIAFIRTL